MSLFPLVGEENAPELVTDEPVGITYAFGANSETLGIKVNTTKQCQLCKKENWKYCCPGCEFKSCSLACVNNHKIQLNCTGKRKMTNFLSRKQITKEALAQDYHYLCEVTRAAENSERDLKKHNLEKEKEHASRLGLLVENTKKFEFKLLTTSTGISRAQTNKSYWNKTKGVSIWTLDVQINPKQKRCFDAVFHGFSGDKSLACMFQTRVTALIPTQPPRKANDLLKAYLFKHKNNEIFTIPSDSLHYFMKVPCSKPDKPSYYRLDPKVSLQEALIHTTFYEFPAISIYVEVPSNFIIVETQALDSDSEVSGNSSEESIESSDSSQDNDLNEDEIDLDGM